jgi:hypothetical protein
VPALTLSSADQVSNNLSLTFWSSIYNYIYNIVISFIADNNMSAIFIYSTNKAGHRGLSLRGIESSDAARPFSFNNNKTLDKQNNTTRFPPATCGNDTFGSYKAGHRGLSLRGIESSDAARPFSFANCAGYRSLSLRGIEFTDVSRNVYNQAGHRGLSLRGIESSDAARPFENNLNLNIETDRAGHRGLSLRGIESTDVAQPFPIEQNTAGYRSLSLRGIEFADVSRFFENYKNLNIWNEKLDEEYHG